MVNLEYDLDTDVTVRRRGKTRLLMLVMLLIAAVGSYFIGFYVRLSTTESHNDKTNEYHGTFQQSVDSSHIENCLRYFSRRPHAAGSARQLELAEHIFKLWTSYGFDKVEMPEYKVLLSHPQQHQPNKVSLIQNGEVQYQINGKINVTADPSDETTFEYIPYLAYSSNGTVEGELVYANNGLDEDFKLLARNNISIKGKIVLCRKISGMILQAATGGAIGALLYPDPFYYSREGQSDDKTYPNTVWSSRDSVFEKPLRRMFGDPLTPGLPSIPGMYRRPLVETGLPGIPSQPISYKDAMYLLSRMNGSKVPIEWRGSLNVTYRFGPGFTTQNTTVRLEIHNRVERMPVYNVIGTITGVEEPDRIILIGNHRDAWLFGAVDPSSGTATLMEMSRIIGKLLKTGWRPKRTIMFCSWAAEEFGLIGSVEWVEQNTNLLRDRAVAYLNTDVAVGGNFVLVAQTCPILVNFIFSWAKKIKDPNGHDGETSMYDIMAERMPSPSHKGEPDYYNYKYMSDYYPFYMNIGVPSADFSYFFGRSKGQMDLYPVYHTQHDTFYWVKKFIDPDFKFHAAMAKFQGGMLLDLADIPLLPFDVKRLADSLLDSRSDFHRYEEKNLPTDHIVRAIYKFGNASEAFIKAKAKLTGKETPLVLRMFNDQMVQVEKAFVSPTMYSRDPINKHVVDGGIFRGARLALYDSKKIGNLREVEKQLSIVAEAISSAADILEPVKSFSLRLKASVELKTFLFVIPTFVIYILKVFCY